MHRQTALFMARKRRDEAQATMRAQAMDLFGKGWTVRATAQKCNISKSTAGRIKKAISSNDTALLAKVLDPGKHRAGRRTVWNPSEAQLLNERIRYAAKMVSQWMYLGLKLR